MSARENAKISENDENSLVQAPLSQHWLQPRFLRSGLLLRLELEEVSNVVQGLELILGPVVPERSGQSHERRIELGMALASVIASRAALFALQASEGGRSHHDDSEVL